jgi:putative transposase
VIFAWIKTQHEDGQCRCRWPLGLMCQVLKVSRSGYYAWRKRKPSKREQKQMGLIPQIREAFAQGRGNYGSPRVSRELNGQGVTICENTVAKLMRREGLLAKPKRRYLPQTTDSAHDCPIAPNHLQQDFTASRPNQKWTSDITFVPTEEGWLYLAVVMDLYSRRIVGWSMQEHLRWELSGQALEMAVRCRRPRSADLLHHSDRGIQYACGGYRKMLQEAGIKPSMSRTGNCYDNAVTESFFATLKTELVNRQHYVSHEQARQSIFEWIEVFYNRQRRHSSLEYLSPEAFEARLN